MKDNSNSLGSGMVKLQEGKNMKWFKEVFIKSLDEKLDAHPVTGIWITENQVNICLKYMKQKSVSTNYFIVIGDYQYTLSIYKKGYGRLTKENKMVAIR